MQEIQIIKGLQIFIYAFLGIIYLLLLIHIIQRKKSYVPIILFSLILISPMIPTGLPLKQYTRLNEIFLIVFVVLCITINVIRNKSIGIKRIEVLLLLIGCSLSFSIFIGYLFLDVMPTTIDFYQVFNIILFCFYLRFGTFFDYKNINVNVMLGIFFMSFMCLNVISLSFLFPWGIEEIIPIYAPERTLIRLQGALTEVGTISRIVGIMGNANSSAMVLVIIIILITAWMVYMPAKKKRHGLLLKLLLVFSNLNVILAFSRSGLITLTISIGYLLWKAAIRDKKNISGAIIIYILFFTLSIAILSYSSTLFGLSVSSLRGFRLSEILTAGDSFYAKSHVGLRLWTWKQGMLKSMISPVFGFGIEHENHRKAALLIGPDTVREFYAAHNEYIDILLTTGIVGLTLYLSFFISVFRKASMILRNNSDEFSIYLARSVKAIIVAIAVFNLAVGIWYNPFIPPILMLIFGAMYGVKKSQRDFRLRKTKTNEF